MEDKKQYVPLFPPEYDHLNDSYKLLQLELDAIDHELDNPRTDRGLTLDFTPPGEKASDDPDMRRKRIEHLNNWREAKVITYKEIIDNEIGGIDKKQKQIIIDRYDFETGRGNFKNYSKHDLKAAKHIEKEDKASFDFMAANYFSKYQVPEIAVADEKENIDVWSDRFTNMLDTFSSGTVPGGLAKGKEIDEPEPDKD